MSPTFETVQSCFKAAVRLLAALLFYLFVQLGLRPSPQQHLNTTLE
jgi:hypothetical protein